MDPWNHATPYASSNGSRYGNSVSNFGAPIGGRYENPLYNFEASNRKDTRKKNKCKRKKRNKSSTSNTNSRNYTFSQNEKLRGGPIESTKSTTRCIEVDSALGSDCVRESKLRGRDSFFHKNHNSVVVKTEVGDDSFHTGCRSAVVKTEVEDDFAYKGHGSAIIKTEVEDGFSHKKHNSVVVKTEVEDDSFHTGRRSAVVKTEVEDDFAYKGHGSAIIKTEVEDGFSHKNHNSVVVKTEVKDDSFHAGRRSAVKTEVEDDFAYKGHGSAIIKTEVEDGFSHTNHNSVVVKTEVEDDSFHTGRRSAVVKTEVEDDFAYKGHGSAIIKTEVEDGFSHTNHNSVVVKTEVEDDSFHTGHRSAVVTTEVEDAFAYNGHCSAIIKTEVEYGFSHKNHNSVVVKTEVEDDSFHTGCRSAVVKTEVEDDFAYKGHGSAIIKTEVEDGFSHKNHNSVVVKTEVKDDSFHTGRRSAVVKTEVEDDFAYKGHGSAIIKTEVEDGFSHKNHNSVVVKTEVKDDSFHTGRRSAVVKTEVEDDFAYKGHGSAIIKTEVEDGFSHTNHNSVVVKTEVEDDSFHTGRRSAVVKTEVEDDFAYKGHGSTIIKTEVEDGFSHKNHNSVVVKTEVKVDSFHTGRRSAVVKTEVEDDFAYKGHGSAIIKTEVEDGFSHTNHNSVVVKTEVVDDSSHTDHYSAVVKTEVEDDFAYKGHGSAIIKTEVEDGFSHTNYNSVVVKTEVEDDSSHTGHRSAVVMTEVEDDFTYKVHGSAIIKTEVEDDFSYKRQNSVVVKPEVEESSDFEELFDYQGKTRSGKRYRRPDWEHVVELQHKKQNVSSDRMQLDWARGQINGNKASKKQKKSTKKQKKGKKQLNRMVLIWPNASKLMDKDGDNFLQTLGEETNLKIRVEYQKIKHSMRYVCAFHGASDRAAKAQEAVERFLYPIGLGQVIKAIPFKSDCSFVSLRENLEILDSSEKYWTHLASLRYHTVQKRENLLRRFSNDKINKQWVNQLCQNYSVLNAMILGKLDVADGLKHMQILRQWLQQSNESSAMTKTVKSSFNYVFKCGSALDIDYSEVIKRFSNSSELQEKIEIKGMLKSGLSMCYKHGWKEDANYYKSLYEKIIVNNYSTNSIEQFKKNHAELKAKMEDSVVVKSSHHSAVAKTEVEESSHFEELFNYQAEARSGNRCHSPDGEHVVELQHKKQNVNPDRRMILRKRMALKLMKKDGVNFLQTLGEKTNLKIRVEKEKVRGHMSYMCIFHGASDRKAEAQESVERFLYPIGTPQVKKIAFKRGCSFASLKKNLELLDSSEKHWTHLASLYYRTGQKKENLLNSSNNKLNKQWVNQLCQNYSVLNAMILGKLDVADGLKHMQILRQWLQQSNESSTMTKTVESSFNYVFNYGSALDIDYLEVIKRFSNGAKLQEKIEIKGILESGVTMCNKHGWKKDLNYYKSLYEKIIINNYSTDSVEQFKKNHAELKAKMKDWSSVKYSKE